MLDCNMASISENLSQVRLRMNVAAERSGRQPGSVELVAVSKSAKVPKIREAIALGLTTFGENRIQDAEPKIAELADPSLRFHMIGHLQSNKVKSAVALFSTIESVDTVRLAEKISQEAVLAGKVMPILVEVNISGETEKYGFKPEEVYGAMDEIVKLPNLKVEGLMGMAPNTADVELRRKSFKTLKGLFSVCKTIKSPNLEMKVLSMGMSDDFETAIEEGANRVRVGRAIFS